MRDSTCYLPMLALALLTLASTGCGGPSVSEPAGNRFAAESYQPDPADIPELRALIRDGDHAQRAVAAKALSEIALAEPGAAEDAIPDLLERLGEYSHRGGPRTFTVYWNGKEVPHRPEKDKAKD